MLNVTIIVNSCDSYSDTWDPFFRLLCKQWPSCPYHIILNTETKRFVSENLDITTVNTPEKIPYSARFLNVLKGIKSEFVIVLLDDFFLRAPVQQAKIEQCIDWLSKDKNIAQFSFESVDDELNIISKEYPGFELRPQCGEYKLNLQAGIWRRNILIKCLRSHESPWDFEIIGNQRTFWMSEKFYSLMSTMPRIMDYRFNNGLYPMKWGVVQGKWVVDTVDALFRSHNIHIDFNERGIYSPLLSKGPVFTYSKRYLIKSLGIYHYGLIYKWGYICKLACLLGKNMPSSYAAYRRQKQEL